ncbi:MAG: hypothetical protein FD136_1389 [Chitinophagaceae bacterium]|nr:MAG: hypothetical protein FD136_1389 [Chitinophagaceae bacterium]
MNIICAFRKVQYLSIQKEVFTKKAVINPTFANHIIYDKMSYEITGKLIAKFDIVQRTETFKTREFVIEKTEDINGRSITNYAKFQCVQDKTAMPDRFNLGDEVKVMFNIKGTKWMKDGRENYITNLDAWRMETLKLQGDADMPASSNYNDIPPAADVVDDLPF